MNYSAIYLEKQKKRILDTLGNEIISISYDKSRVNSVQLPKFRVHVTRKPANKLMKKPPVIRVLSNVEKIESLGVVICSVPLRPDQLWRPKQKRQIAIFRIGSSEEKMYSKVRSIRNTIVGLNRVEFDEANRLIRLIGADVSITGEGPWIQVD